VFPSDLNIIKILPFLTNQPKQSEELSVVVTDSVVVTVRRGVPRCRMLPDIMTGRTEIQPLPRPRYANIVCSIDAGPQQPFILRAVGFVAVRAGKNVVVATIAIRGDGHTHPTVLMAPSMFISARCPVNGVQVPAAFCTVNIATVMAYS
jgi:hypothetical protein